MTAATSMDVVGAASRNSSARFALEFHAVFSRRDEMVTSVLRLPALVLLGAGLGAVIAYVWMPCP